MIGIVNSMMFVWYNWIELKNIQVLYLVLSDEIWQAFPFAYGSNKEQTPVYNQTSAYLHFTDSQTVWLFLSWTESVLWTTGSTKSQMYDGMCVTHFGLHKRKVYFAS